ncbi:MAG: peptidylprolyl isomerase [Xanthomonadales bacterium]|nr:peptidylprolyl isomerase [Xanthomonadales bacterium]NIX12257.1 peptidylprolyl isomerase [Xanthomonadales bacterium]
MTVFHRTKAWLLVACLATAGLATPLQAQVKEGIDHIVALVDEEIVLRSELDTAIDGIVERIRAQGGSLPPQDLLEKQVLERLVLRKLQIQRAFQTGIRVSDADVDQAITTLAQQNGMTIMQMRQVIEADGEDFSEFRRSIGEEIMTERLRQRVVNNMDPITDTEIEILLASEDFAGGEYHISHIMLNLPEGATPRQAEDIARQAEDIHAQLEGGLDFASAAISYSQSQEALDGGEVGWRDLNSVPREFADAIRNLRAGQFTVPIRSPAGFHIVRVNDYRDTARVIAREFNARHILIETNELVTPRDAMEQIRDLRERIVNGEEFAELAREYSDDPTSANLGGDMGWFQENAYGDRIAQILAGMADDDLSEAFQSQIGWHIIQRLGFRETDVSEEAMRNRARNSIRQSKADAEIDRYLRQMREEAFVELRIAS